MIQGVHRYFARSRKVILQEGIHIRHLTCRGCRNSTRQAFGSPILLGCCDTPAGGETDRGAWRCWAFSQPRRIGSIRGPGGDLSAFRARAELALPGLPHFRNGFCRCFMDGPALQDFFIPQMPIFLMIPPSSFDWTIGVFFFSAKSRRFYFSTSIAELSSIQLRSAYFNLSGIEGFLWTKKNSTCQ